MRRAKSYGIVDHQLLHGGYLHQMSHPAMSLYLFLLVVSDREGKSFYGEATIQGILRLSQIQFGEAVDQLLALKLINYRRPYFWLLNLDVKSRGDNVPLREESDGRQNKDPIPKRRQKAVVSTNRTRDWHLAKEGIQDLFRQLEGTRR